MKFQLVGVVLVVVLFLYGCTSRLNTADARAVVEANSLMRPTDTVTIEAVSPTSDTEAIVRATINGRTLNLKFRRFDTGWTWEFVETKAGGWIAPDIAIGQLREEQRTVAAAAWAEQNRVAYASTAQTMEYVALYHVPNPSELENYDLWIKLKRMMAEDFKKRPDMKTGLQCFRTTAGPTHGETRSRLLSTARTTLRCLSVSALIRQKKQMMTSCALTLSGAGSRTADGCGIMTRPGECRKVSEALLSRSSTNGPTSWSTRRL